MIGRWRLLKGISRKPGGRNTQLPSPPFALCTLPRHGSDDDHNSSSHVGPGGSPADKSHMLRMEEQEDGKNLAPHCHHEVTILALDCSSLDFYYMRKKKTHNLYKLLLILSWIPKSQTQFIFAFFTHPKQIFPTSKGPWKNSVPDLCRTCKELNFVQHKVLNKPVHFSYMAASPDVPSKEKGFM